MASSSSKRGSHLCDKHKLKHKHKLATFPHVKQAQENKAYASTVTLEEISKLIQDGGRRTCTCAYRTPVPIFEISTSVR